jgi:hypothetical protein
MGFYAKGMDGRIDDPNAGWKGRGLWSTYGIRAPFHVEGGKGTTSKVGGKCRLTAARSTEMVRSRARDEGESVVAWSASRFCSLASGRS